MQKWEEVFKLTSGNLSVQKDRRNNGVKIVNFVTSKNWLKHDIPAPKHSYVHLDLS